MVIATVTALFLSEKYGILFTKLAAWLRSRSARVSPATDQGMQPSSPVSEAETAVDPVDQKEGIE